MLNYVNSVSCSTSDKKTEIILTFRQVHPIVAADGSISGNAEELISEIVMNHDLALALKTMLDKAISSESIVQ